jgi:hypothetical protein
VCKNIVCDVVLNQSANLILCLASNFTFLQQNKNNPNSDFRLFSGLCYLKKFEHFSPRKIWEIWSAQINVTTGVETLTLVPIDKVAPASMNLAQLDIPPR